jgi:hypothetical protein
MLHDFILIHPHNRAVGNAEIPRLGFAFLGHLEMVILLISGILPDMVSG